MRDVEIDAIIEYIEIELEWERVTLSQEAVDELRAYLKRLRPTTESITESLFRLFEEEGGKKRLYAKELMRFMRAAKAVIEVDKIIHPLELDFVKYIIDAQELGRSLD